MLPLRVEVWAPVQHILVLGLRRLGSRPALALAAELAQRFLRAVVTEWQATGLMHEKCAGGRRNSRDLRKLVGSELLPSSTVEHSFLKKKMCP